MNVRVFLGCALLLFALALVSSCSTKAKSPIQPSTKLEGSSLDAAAVFGGSAREGGFGAFEPRDLGGDGGSRFFPLDSGSVWIYARDSRTVIVDPAVPPDTVIDHSTATIRMLGKVDFGGTLYTLSTETTFRDEREFENDVYYRQDATGLYELDYLIRDPLRPARVLPSHEVLSARIARTTPASHRTAMLRALADLEGKIARIDGLLHAARPILATGPQGQPEIQRLAYPLFVGRQWIVRADPLFTEKVEAREGVIVGDRRLAAWRIRIESELFGSEDRVWIWMSHEGELRFRYHVEGVVTDDTGNPVGTVVTDEDQRLVEYQLAGAPPVGPGSSGPFGSHTALHEATVTR